MAAEFTGASVKEARTVAEAQRNVLVLLAGFGVMGVPRMVPMDDDEDDLPTHPEALARDLVAAVLAA